MNVPHYRQFCRLSRLGLGSLLAAVSFTAFGQVNVLTQHNDISRSGANTQETILTTANVNQSQFGKIFTDSVDGQVYAQPLYVSALSLAGGTHNVVYVCTEHNSVYAFDAKTGGAALWHVNLGPSVTDQNCGDITPEVGITGTPVIDLTTNTLYVSAETEVGANTFHTLHALDLGTGAEKFGAPVTITATVSGVTFDPFNQGQRPGLLLLNGVVYIADASHCDNNVWHGWVLGYRAGPSTISQVAAFCTTSSGTGGGIWACGMGPAADASGFIYVNTGNGSWDGNSNFGDSFLKLSTVGGLSVADYFTPHNQAALSSADLDIGTGGAVLVPPNYVVGLAKSGSMYLCNRNNMGHFNATTDSCLQVFSATGVNDTTSSSPVYWVGPSKQYLFIACGDDTPKAYQFTGTSVNTTALGQGSVVSDRPGGTSLSSNGTANGILWTVGSNSIIYAYNAVSFPAVLWNSSQNAGRDGLGTYVKFSTPTIANGMVYVGTSNQLVAYGLIGGGLPQVATPTFSPGGGAYAGAQSVTIGDSTGGASIRYTLDGSTPSETAGTLYTGAVNIGSTVTLNAIAYLSGDADSPVASATYTIGTGIEGPFGGTPATIPGTVQAENYDTGGQGVGYNVTTVNGTDNGYRPDGVDLEVTTDTGGGVNLGWTAAGQWFKYTVNVATAGTYTVSFRVAAATAAVTDAFHLANSSGTNLSGSVNVPATGAWQTWTTVTANVTLPAGQQVLTLDQDTPGWNLNDMSFTTVGTLTSVITAIAGPNGSISPSGTVTVNNGANQTFTITPNPGYVVASVTDNGTSLGAVTTYTFTDVQVNHEISATFQLQSSGEGPFGGTPAAVPGTVQAENYDTGGQGVAYNVTTVNGTDNAYRSDGVDLEVTTDTGGGVDLGWTAAGQWFKYTVNVATAGTYTVSFRVAAPAAVADAFHLVNSSGTNLSGSVNVPASGGYQVWVTVTANVTLPAGQQVLTVDQDNAGWNLNYMSFASSGATTFTITGSAGAGGSISPSGAVVVNQGANQAFTITPNAGFNVSSVTVDGVNQGAITSFAFTNVQANHTISAAFQQQTSGEGPFGGTAAAVPGTVQAENYDTGGQGVAYNVTTVNGTDNAYRSDGVDLEVTTDTGGGVDLGWTAAGQWFKYTVNVATAGTYTVSFRVAAPAAVADAFHLVNSSGTNLSGSVNVPASGGYQVWVTVTANVTLPAGQQVLTVDQDNTGWNLNYMSFASSGGAARTLAGTSTSGFQALAISPAATGTFTATYDATPSLSPENSLVGLSSGAAGAYANIACIGRFNPTGQIDAYNGTVFAAASTINYLAGVSYHFRFVVDVTTHTYSVYVTPAGGTELTVGLNYAFRSTANTMTSLSDWNLDVNAAPAGCSLTASNLAP